MSGIEILVRTVLERGDAAHRRIDEIITRLNSSFHNYARDISAIAEVFQAVADAVVDLRARVVQVRKEGADAKQALEQRLHDMQLQRDADSDRIATLTLEVDKLRHASPGYAPAPMVAPSIVYGPLTLPVVPFTAPPLPGTLSPGWPIPDGPTCGHTTNSPT